MEEAAPPKFQHVLCALSTDSTDEARDWGLTDFPVRDSPGVGHPVGDIRAPVPGPLGRRDRVEIGIGGSFCGGKAALLLTDRKAEAGQASLEGGHMTSFDRLDGGSGWGAILLVVE